MGRKATDKTEQHSRERKWERAFLAQLAKLGTVTKAAAVADVSRTMVHDYRKENPEFAAKWDDALEQYADKLEDEADRRAHDGWLEPVFYKGEVCGHVQKFSDTLLLAKLKAKRPKEYRERLDLNQEGGPVPFMILGRDRKTDGDGN